MMSLKSHAYHLSPLIPLARRPKVKSFVLSAACCVLSARPLAIVAEGRGRPGDVGRTRPTGAAEALEQFADRLLQLHSPGKRAHDRTPVVTSPSVERATLRGLALRIFETYPNMPWYHPEKQGWEKTRIIQFLAEECSPSHEKVQEAVETYLSRFRERPDGTEAEGTSNPTSSATNAIAPSLTHLQHACVPEYESVITHLLQIQADRGLAFLLLLRRDVLNWIAYQHDQPSHDQLTLIKTKHFDHFLCRLFQTWFAPGLLRVERITYEKTSAAVVERIARNEAVHPVQNLQDLRKRLGPDRRVFCLFHPLLAKSQPLVVLYVSLGATIPHSMDMIHDPDSSYSTISPKVATFYSISNFETGLKGVGLGEFLIHQAVDELRRELPDLDTFCTLSPLPRFRAWLQERSAAMGGKFASQDLLDAMTTERLAKELNVGPEQAIPAMVQYMQDSTVNDEGGDTEGGRFDDKPVMPAIQEALLKLAAHYLIHEKHRRQPLDPVARFHVGNGAIVHAIRWRADNSRKGWSNSFGVMVNYKYDLDRLVENQAQYENSFAIPMSDDVRELVE